MIYFSHSKLNTSYEIDNKGGIEVEQPNINKVYNPILVSTFSSLPPPPMYLLKTPYLEIKHSSKKAVPSIRIFLSAKLDDWETQHSVKTIS